MCRVCSCSQLLGQYPDVISCVQTMEERSQDAQASFKDGKGRKRRESVSLCVCVCLWVVYMCGTDCSRDSASLTAVRSCS